MKTRKTYEPRVFDLAGLNGISDKTLNMHFELYAGYVRQTNAISERIAELIGDGSDVQASAEYQALTRRLGFEYNGMVLHELYFGNLTSGEGAGRPRPGSAFSQALGKSFPGVDAWKTDFASVGAMRGVGWVICYQNPTTGRLSNHWIELHEAGHVAGFKPILVMDVWEHAYLLDYNPSDRPKYIDAFFSNVDWKAVDDRIIDVERRTASAA